jgi:TetR/AcrR family transcriptional repressor of mexJK operon
MQRTGEYRLTDLSPKCPTRRAVQREERRAAILTIARRHFHDHGYGGTSMSAIATELGGSKGTLWAYFPSKEELFAATMEELIAEYVPFLHLEAWELIEPALTRYAEHFLRFTLSPKVIALNRIIIAEAPRFPEVGRIFFDQGPRRRHQALAEFLVEKMRQGQMRIGDAQTASTQFHHLCHCRQFMRVLWGVAGETNPALIAREAGEAVALFLHGNMVGQQRGGVRPEGLAENPAERR